MEHPDPSSRTASSLASSGSEDFMEMQLEQQNSFWHHEKEVRQRTATLTANDYRVLARLDQSLASRLSREPTNYVLIELWSTQLLEDSGSNFVAG